MNIHKTRLFKLIGFGLVILVLSACGGSNKDEDTTPPEEVPVEIDSSLEGTLNRLGVDTSQTPRLDNNGDPYPDDYTPLGGVVPSRLIVDNTEADGNRLVLGRSEELLLLGYRPTSESGVLTVIDDLPSGIKQNGFTVSSILYQQTSVETPWAVDRNPQGNPASGPPLVQGALRDATAADVNGDGFLSTAVLYFIASDNEIRLRVTDANGATSSETDVSIAISTDVFPVNDLRITSGDFDGDGKEEIAFAISRVQDNNQLDTPVGVYIIDDEASGFSVMSSHILSLDTTLDAPHITLALESAHLDHGSVDELVLVVNENLPNPSPGTFSTRYFAFEIVQNVISVISTGPIVATVDGVSHIAELADLETADLDGDSIDEIIFAGLEQVSNNCVNSDDLGQPLSGLKHVLVALGNKFNDFEAVKSSAAVVGYANCPATGFRLRYAHVNALDFDGDGDIDIQVNNRIFDDFPVGNWDVGMGKISSAILFGDSEQLTWYDRANSTMTVSDQSGDGVDDIISLLLDPDSGDISVWRCDDVLDGSGGKVENKCLITRETRVALNPNDLTTSSVDPINTHVNPVIIPVDVDNDEVILIKYELEHFLDFTEPVILAALAAPPCEGNIGQNIDACTTTWGSSSSVGVEQSYNVTVSGSVTGGVGFAGGGVEVEMLGIYSVAASRETSNSYELTRSRSFTTGSLEDSVVFTSIPIDRYVYTTISSFDPTMIGNTLTVNLPRETITLIAAKDYYNANIQDDALHVDERVFQHVPGQVSSYPIELEKDAILQQEKSLLDDARTVAIGQSMFDPIEALGGLETSVISVGQGGGSTELALEYSETEGQANALELGYEFEFKMLAGVAVGFSVGISGERTLSISHGNTSVYSGAIGSIPADSFPENLYQYGLFSYIQALDGQEFEVINYWVDMP